MRVTRLKLANVRVIESAEFEFQPGINLIVGVNGVGKTTVLDALRFSLSPLVKHVNRLRTTIGFPTEDIRVGTDALSVQCGFEIEGESFTYLIHKPRHLRVAHEKLAGMPRSQVSDTPDKSDFIGRTPRLATDDQIGGRPLAIYFSTRRAVPVERAPSKSAAAGGVRAALAEGLSHRMLRLSEFAEWMVVQQALKVEATASRQMLLAFEDTVRRFLPGYCNLRAEDADEPKLLIDHGRTSLEVRQLSDGERGTLAMVLDVTRRLAQANPKMNYPAAEAEAVVMIDELDLHLHPKWQRQIGQNLTAAFPKCQFIVTTHSPQIVAAVEPECVHLMIDSSVLRPDRSRGMDSNWILRHLMQTEDRPAESRNAIEAVEGLINAGKFEEARNRIARERENGLELTEWSIFEARMARMEVLGE